MKKNNQILHYLQTLDFSNAYRELLKSPYDTHDLSMQLLIHYLDAAAFGTRGDLFLASKELLASLKQDSSFLIEYEDFFNYLEQMHIWIQISLDPKANALKNQYPEAVAYRELEQQSQMHLDKIEKLLRFVPAPLKESTQHLISRRLQLNRLLHYCLPSLSDPFHSPFPWIFPTTKTQLPLLPQEDLPIALYLDPLSENLKEYLHTHRNRKLWLLFENQTMALQAISKLDELSPNHYYHSLNTPQSEQWMDRPSWQPQTVLGDSLNFETDETLFSSGLQISFQMALKRLGASYLLPLTQRYRSIHWHSKQKMAFTASKKLKHHIEHLVKIHPHRIDFEQKRPLKIAHLTAQLVDGGHAPSQLVESILSHHDKELFDPILICCEEAALRTCEYPFNLYTSLPSAERGAQRLKRLQNLNIPIFMDDGSKSIETTAQKISALLDQQEIDIAIFHSPSLLHILCAAGCKVPLKVLFEHGTLPYTKGFDYAILSAQETKNQHVELFKELKIETSVHTFPVDCRAHWEERRYSAARVGLPEDGFLMTTISNNLELRLTIPCLDAIGRILQQCPYAYYAPIGHIKNIKTFREFFYAYGVEDRIMPLGHQENPSQIARSMHLYLNEFPIGSGFGALEAMSAGCPIVTMYDEEGPPAAQYAAIYFGKERSVQKGDIEGYIQLAVSLYSDKEKYQEWSVQARRQYEARFNIDEYMISFERTLLEWKRERERGEKGS